MAVGNETEGISRSSKVDYKATVEALDLSSEDKALVLQGVETALAKQAPRVYYEFVMPVVDSSDDMDVCFTLGQIFGALSREIRGEPIAG